MENDRSEMVESKNRATSIMARILLRATVIQNMVGLFCAAVIFTATNKDDIENCSCNLCFYASVKKLRKVTTNGFMKIWIPISFGRV